jgi:hypothetical protein
MERNFLLDLIRRRIGMARQVDPKAADAMERRVTQMEEPPLTPRPGEVTEIPIAPPSNLPMRIPLHQQVAHWRGQSQFFQQAITEMHAQLEAFHNRLAAAEAELGIEGEESKPPEV